MMAHQYDVITNMTTYNNGFVHHCHESDYRSQTEDLPLDMIPKLQYLSFQLLHRTLFTGAGVLGVDGAGHRAMLLGQLQSLQGTQRHSGGP